MTLIRYKIIPLSGPVKISGVCIKCNLSSQVSSKPSTLTDYFELKRKPGRAECMLSNGRYSRKSEWGSLNRKRIDYYSAREWRTALVVLLGEHRSGSKNRLRRAAEAK